MVQLFRFRTGRFDPAAETPNPINPIPGEALLAWLCRDLRTRGYIVEGPAPEDWGWYAYVGEKASRHLVGASGEPVEDNRGGEVDWALQIHRLRRLRDFLPGRRREPDPGLIGVIETLIRTQSDFSAVESEIDR